jgi:hypothetical protein
MTAFILIFTLLTLLLFIPVLLGYRKHDKLHHVDFMAGDEGED